MNVFSVDVASDYLINFITKYDIKTLNFGGSRGSVVPTIQAFTKESVELAIDKYLINKDL